QDSFVEFHFTLAAEFSRQYGGLSTAVCGLSTRQLIVWPMPDPWLQHFPVFALTRLIRSSAAALALQPARWLRTLVRQALDRLGFYSSGPSQRCVVPSAGICAAA